MNRPHSERFLLAFAMYIVAAGGIQNAIAQCPSQCVYDPNLHCNQVTSKTVLAPDTFRAWDVYETVQTTCGPSVVKSCKASFHINANDPNFAIGDPNARINKCKALANAISGSAACTAAGYTIDPNACATTQTFKITDSCAGGSISLGISNDPNIISQEGDDPNKPHPIPDYEAELITPGCKHPDPNSPAPNANDDVQHVLVLAGPASGEALSPIEPAHVELVIASDPNNPTTIELPTRAGESAEGLAGRLGGELARQGIKFQCVGRTLRLQADFMGTSAADSLAFGTFDTGIRFSNSSGPRSALPNAATQSSAIPTLSEWGLIILAALLLIGGSLLVLRKRTRATVA